MTCINMHQPLLRVAAFQLPMILSALKFSNKKVIGHRSAGGAASKTEKA